MDYRMNNKDVYEVLEDLGMTSKEIDKAFEISKSLSNVTGKDIDQMIDFYKTYGLTNEDIIKIENKNPYFLIENFVRIRFLEEDYRRIEITDFAELLKKHPSAMSINPQHLYDYINNKLNNGENVKDIRNTVMNDFENLFPYMKG